MVSIEIDCVRCWGARVVRAKQTDFLNEECGVGVEPKVLTYPRNFVAGGAARICAFIRASVDVTTVCVTCTGVEKVCVVR